MVQPPRGFYPARVDEKGRLKLPAVMQQFLSDLGESKVFITTLDERIARIYPTSVWAANESLLATAGEDAEYAAAVSFLADHFGADSDVDSQGRVLMPQELRKALELENQPVWLKVFNGRISVYSKSVYDEELRSARVRAPEGVKALEKRGLK